MTIPRSKILQLLETANNKHLSAEDIYQYFQTQEIHIALATIYRVLAQFETAGLVYKHNFTDDHAVYEINNGEHHDHLVCTSCQKVEEFINPIIEEQQELIATKMGYQITGHSLHLYGLCRDCQE